MNYSHELFSKELGERLKQMRKDRGWTHRDMVIDHGFHLTHWQGFENGKSISVPSLLRVCGVFNILLEDLVRGLGFSETGKTDVAEVKGETKSGQRPIAAPRSKNPKV